MKDTLCPCHDVLEQDTESSKPSLPSVRSILGNRPTERYVPKDITCEQCGTAAPEFTWFQRIPADAVETQTPPHDLYFCDIVCLSLYSSANFEEYDPDLLSLTIDY